MSAATAEKPRTKPPEERREELMDAAQSLFREKGVVQTTIEQITVAAGVAKGTFYLHFSSKDDVLAALRSRWLATYSAKIQAAVDKRPSADWPGKLRAWVRAAVDGYFDTVEIHDLVFHEPVPVSTKTIPLGESTQQLARLLELGNAANAWAVDDCAFAAAFFFSGFHGSIDYETSKQKPIGRSALIKRLQDLMLRTVRPVDPTSA
jgi:AcrR family transcriptional regulator